MLVKEYYSPVFLEDALHQMNEPGQVKALAGGTDLAISLNERTIRPDAVVDLSGIEELKRIEMIGEDLHIGSMATFAQIAEDEVVKAMCPMLAAAALSVGSPQVRNLGTIGGNLANAATAADTVPALMAADAKAVVRKEGGERILPVTEIPCGLNKTVLEPNELICEFILRPAKGSFTDFEKVGRRKALAISRINMAIVLERENDVITKAALAYGAVGKTAYRASALETYLTGRKIDADTIDGACELAEQIVTEVLNGRSTTPYKKKIASAVLRRALIKASGGGEEK